MQDNTKQSVLIGVANRNRFVQLNVDNGTRGHFSCTTDVFIPIRKDKAIAKERESLIDLFSRGEHFMNQSTEEIIEDDDGGFKIQRTVEMSEFQIFEHFDNSLCPIQLDIGERIYVFESGSCGQVEAIHDEIEDYFIDPELHKQIFTAWDNHHMDDDFRLDLELPEQNKRELLKDKVEEIVAY